MAWLGCIGREVSFNAFSLYSNLLGQEFLFLPLMSFYFFVFLTRKIYGWDGTASKVVHCPPSLGFAFSYHRFKKKN